MRCRFFQHAWTQLKREAEASPVMLPLSTLPLTPALMGWDVGGEFGRDTCFRWCVRGREAICHHRDRARRRAASRLAVDRKPVDRATKASLRASDKVSSPPAPQRPEGPLPISVNRSTARISVRRHRDTATEKTVRRSQGTGRKSSNGAQPSPIAVCATVARTGGRRTVSTLVAFQNPSALLIFYSPLPSDMIQP